MSPTPDQPDAPRNSDRPSGPDHPRAVTGQGADQIDELDLLGWVEGDLPRARQQPVESLLAREPRLRALLTSMASDRAALRSLPIDRAPADLLAGVEARLERDLLVGLSGTDAGTLDIPVSRVVVRHGPVLARLGRAPLARVGAVAALLVVAGAIGLVTVQSLGVRTGPNGHSPAPVLLGAETDTSATLAKSSSGGNSDPNAEALGTTPETEITPSLSALALDNTEPETPLVALDESVTPDRAVELLREHRLAIVVRTLDRDRTLQRLAAIHAEPRTTWSLLDRADGAVLAALTPAPADEAGTISPSTLASSREPTETGSAPAPFIPSTPPVPPRSVYIAEADAAPRALTALRGALNAGRSQAAQFVALDTPLPLPPAASIDAVLWWTRPPSGWVQRHTLPIIVDPVAPK